MERLGAIDFVVAVLLLVPHLAEGFILRHPFAANGNGISSQLLALEDWRDRVLRNAELSQKPPTGDLCALIRSCSEVVLPGESKYLQLYDEDDIELFCRVMDHDNGIFAMGLRADDGETLYDTASLMEVEDYILSPGDKYGIFVKCNAVGRVQIKDLVATEPYATVRCEELADSFWKDLLIDQAEHVASKIETLLSDTSKLELQYEGWIPQSLDDDDVISRQDRFNLARQVALVSDTQGYVTNARRENQTRSLAELSALSWAAFSSSRCVQEDSTFRLHALDMVSLMDRLTFAVYWLTDKQKEAEAKLSGGGGVGESEGGFAGRP